MQVEARWTVHGRWPDDGYVLQSFSHETMLKRTVSVSRIADRHAAMHSRDFTKTRVAVVEDGELRKVVDNALTICEFEEGGRFVIRVEEPHE